MFAHFGTHLESTALEEKLSRKPSSMQHLDAATVAAVVVVVVVVGASVAVAWCGKFAVVWVPFYIINCGRSPSRQVWLGDQEDHQSKRNRFSHHSP